MGILAPTEATEKLKKVKRESASVAKKKGVFVEDDDLFFYSNLK